MTLGIVGDGTMGRDIVLHCAAFPLRIRWVVKEPPRRPGLEALLARRIRRLERYGDNAGEICSDSIVSHDAAILADCHLVIEAVSENPDLKIRVTSLIEDAVSSDCIIVSNSSSVSGSISSSELRHPERALGLHFFHPLAMRDIVEMNIWETTSDVTISFCREFLDVLGMKSLEFGPGNHFLLNRILLPLQATAAALLIDDTSDQRVIELDDALGREILPGGAFHFFDAVGFNVVLPSVRSYRPADAHPWYEGLCKVLEEMTTAGFYGVKSGAGFYLYPDKVVNPELPSLLENLHSDVINSSPRENPVPLPDPPSDSGTPSGGGTFFHPKDYGELFFVIWAETGRRLMEAGNVPAESLNKAILEVTGGTLGPVDAFHKYKDSDADSGIHLVDWRSDSCSQLDIKELVSIL